MKHKRISDPELRYITRYHDKKPGYKGWWVRLQDYHSMTMLGQKAFYDHHYPQPYGKYAALVDAMLYRDKLAEKVGGYFIDKIEKEICPYYNTIKRRDNKSGHVWCRFLNCKHHNLITIQDATPFLTTPFLIFIFRAKAGCFSNADSTSSNTKNTRSGFILHATLKTVKNEDLIPMSFHIPSP